MPSLPGYRRLRQSPSCCINSRSQDRKTDPGNDGELGHRGQRSSNSVLETLSSKQKGVGLNFTL